MLSVIIPTYNRETVLARALDSVLNQAANGFANEIEIIVVDDGSTDNTAQLIAKDYPQVVYVHQQNKSVSAARNAGLSIAKGDWLALLDSDDEWLAHKLGAQFQLLETSGLKICHTQEIWIRDGVRVNQMNKHQKSGGWIFERCLPLCAMSPSSIIIHKEVFDRVGNFDESLPACEDYDLWLRIASRFEVAYVEQACINKYGGHDDQLSRQYWGMDRFRVIALQKILKQQPAIAQAMATAARTMLIKKLTILLKGAIKHGNEELASECRRSLLEYS